MKTNAFGIFSQQYAPVIQLKRGDEVEQEIADEDSDNGSQDF